MSGIVIPLALAVAAILAAFATYRGIRRGGARFYALEREAILQRASLTLLATAALFLASIGLLIYQRQQMILETTVQLGDDADAVTVATPTSQIEQFPPTGSPTPDLSNMPTPTATPVVCRAVVEGTGGNGLKLRDNPNGSEVTILAEGSILTLLEEAPSETNGIVWRLVRAVGGDEGWVAQDFLNIRAPCE